MEKTIPNWVKKRAYLTPKRIALRFKDEQYSFQQLYEKTLQVSRQLQNYSLSKGAYVGVLLKNNAETVFILYALQMCGYRTVLLNNRLTAKELTYQLQDSGSELLIADHSFKGIIDQVNDLITNLKVSTPEEIFSLKEKEFQPTEEFSLDDICSVMYTSGTTGKPKGVLQTYGNHWWSAVGSVLNLGLSENDCWLLSVPLFHISGYSILIRGITYGITVDLHETFDERRINKAIMTNNVTIISVVSTMLIRLLDNLKNQKYPDTFRCMLLGGGPAPKPLLEKCVELKIPIFQTYGMTETSSQIVTLAPEDSLNKIGSAGKPLFPAQLRIETVNGKIAKSNVAGEIIVKGPNVAKGYISEQSIVNVKGKDGWFRTGDIGYLDDDGFLYVLDRRADLIISGGENIYPAEIEATIISHQDVEDVGVIGVKDDRWGQVPIAFVVLKNDATITENELLEYCCERLASYKVPKQVIFKQKLPRNATNKLMRKELRKLIK